MDVCKNSIRANRRNTVHSASDGSRQMNSKTFRKGDAIRDDVHILAVQEFQPSSRFQRLSEHEIPRYCNWGFVRIRIPEEYSPSSGKRMLKRRSHLNFATEIYGDRSFRVGKLTSSDE
ncbi:Uncharacterised protein r2_g1834 [Pycnogonum litorale]